MNHTKSQAYNHGYQVGKSCNLHRAIQVPENYKGKDHDDFMKGFDHAVEDRLS